MRVFLLILQRLTAWTSSAIPMWPLIESWFDQDSNSSE
jgi:hypothetical protein